MFGGSGVNVSVNTDNRAETEEAKQRVQGLGKRLNDIAEDGASASIDLTQIGRLRQLMSSVDPGTRTALLEFVRSQTGTALDPNASNVQAASAMVEYMVPRMRVPGSGTSTDRDMNSFRTA